MKLIYQVIWISKNSNNFAMKHGRKNMDLSLLIYGITHIVEDFGIIILTFIFHQDINKFKINLII